MEGYKVSYPDSSSFVNREQRYCPVCNHTFMKGAEGVMISYEDYNAKPFIPYGKEWFCSELCVTHYILSNMGSGKSAI
jgi:hypothetical protein